MHPYLEDIHRDMNRTYEALQAKIQRSRMQTVINNGKPVSTPATTPTITKEPMGQFSTTVESLIAQFTDYQANSLKQLTASLINYRKSQLLSTSPVEMSLSSVGIRLSNKDRHSTKTATDTATDTVMDMDTTLLSTQSNSITAKLESVSTNVNTAIDHHRQPQTTCSQPSSIAIIPTTPCSLPLPPSTVRFLWQLEPLTVMYDADDNLTLQEFARQLKVVFDRNPSIFKTDADRVKYALQSMGEHTTRYFEPFLNKTVNDHQKCLSKYPVFLTTLRLVFGTPLTPQRVSEARDQLLNIQQTDSMVNYVKAIRDLNAIARWGEQTIMTVFKDGISPEIIPYFRKKDQYKTLSQLQEAACRVYATHTGLRRQKEREQLKAAKWARQTQELDNDGLSLEQEGEPDKVNSQPWTEGLPSTPDELSTSTFTDAVPEVGPGVKVVVHGKMSRKAKRKLQKENKLGIYGTDGKRQ
jgi:hypothetical protein